MRSYWIKVGPKSSMTDVLLRRGKSGQKDTQGQHHVMREAEIGVMQLQAKECQGLPVTTRR